MTILIPLSGGLDSTYVAYKALSEGHKILPMYITIQNLNISKRTIEVQQSRKIHLMLTKQFGKDNVYPLQEFTVRRRQFASQFDCWINAIHENASMMPKFHQIHFGATKSDIDEWTPDEMLMSRLKEVRKTLCKDSYYPLYDLLKADISKLLPVKYMKEVFTCEIPLYKRNGDKVVVSQCTKCNSCHLHQINGLALSNFVLAQYIDDKDIRDNNNEHNDYIECSNIYGQQDKKDSLAA
jgi:7-cyano-7-deazaguanine synthase in queuosine biosynthesis